MCYRTLHHQVTATSDLTSRVRRAAATLALCGPPGRGMPSPQSARGPVGVAAVFCQHCWLFYYRGPSTNNTSSERTQPPLHPK